ncbi:MAG: ribonuclease HI family protein [Candidatus Levybacteria bacterium]|nr:ribonuclease HI family protein [Candidatus Levybacteria bacterium]
MSKIYIFTDGGARGNPGPAAIGVAIKKDNFFLTKIGRKIGFNTNNFAEYSAVIEGLKYLKENPSCLENIDEIIFFMDSELVASQVNGIYKVKSPKLRKLLMELRLLEQQIQKEIIYRHIKREENKIADGLVNMALDNKI